MNIKQAGGGGFKGKATNEVYAERDRATPAQETKSADKQWPVLIGGTRSEHESGALGPSEL
jgi:hypothetical protein